MKIKIKSLLQENTRSSYDIEHSRAAKHQHCLYKTNEKAIGMLHHHLSLRFILKQSRCKLPNSSISFVPEEMVVSPEYPVSVMQLDGTHDSRAIYKCPGKRQKI